MLLLMTFFRLVFDTEFETTEVCQLKKKHSKRIWKQLLTKIDMLVFTKTIHDTLKLILMNTNEVYFVKNNLSKFV